MSLILLQPVFGWVLGTYFGNGFADGALGVGPIGLVGLEVFLGLGMNGSEL